MKVIFLDIDGVLNTPQTFIEIHNEYVKTGIKRIEIDLNRLTYLKRIVEQTGAVIVLSSSWRNLGKMENGSYIPLAPKMVALVDLFKKYGLSIYDITPKDIHGIRQNEIDLWLKDKDIESFIILDDSYFDLQKFLHKELINTSLTLGSYPKNIENCTGLCEYHVMEAIKKLTLIKK